MNVVCAEARVCLHAAHLGMIPSAQCAHAGGAPQGMAAAERRYS